MNKKIAEDPVVSATRPAVRPSWLAVRAGRERVLLPLSHAAEVFSLPAVTPIPHTRVWLLGLVGLRGTVCTAVDLAAFLQHTAPAKRDFVSRLRCRLVRLNPVLGVDCALLLDEVFGLQSVAAFASSEAASEDGSSYWGHVYTDHEGLRWQELDLQRLAVNPAFTHIRM